MRRGEFTLEEMELIENFDKEFQRLVRKYRKKGIHLATADYKEIVEESVCGCKKETIKDFQYHFSPVGGLDFWRLNFINGRCIQEMKEIATKSEDKKVKAWYWEE